MSEPLIEDWWEGNAPEERRVSSQLETCDGIKRAAAIVKAMPRFDLGSGILLVAGLSA